MTERIDYGYVYGDGLDVTMSDSGMYIVLVDGFPWEACETHDEAIKELSNLSAFPVLRGRAKAYAADMLEERRNKATSGKKKTHADKIGAGFRNENVAQFFEQRLVLADGAFVAKDAVYDAYAAWSADPLSRQSFMRALVQHFTDVGAEVFSSRMTVGGKSHNIYKGVKLA